MSSLLGSETRSAPAAHLEIDLRVLRRNVARLRALVAPAKFAGVVKANAYGHGLVRVAKALASDVEMLCVYRADEGLEIRAAGINTPVLVLGPVAASELAAAHEANLALTLWDTTAYRDEAVRIARASGRPLPVHAKIDTGVTRLGLDADRAALAISEYLNDPALELEGAFTHLAAVEELESDYTINQLLSFERALAPVDAALQSRGVLRHAAASAAAMLFPRLRLDLVRVGIATYGLWPSPETRRAWSQPFTLEPALSWKTRLVVVRDVPEGTFVGYGCTYRTDAQARIGVIPIGYAEGIPRAVSNRGAVLVGGKRAPIVGRVCMNMTLVDVTNVPEAHPGTPVTLIGQDGEFRLEAEDWADWSDTIDYEIVARLPSEITRLYTNDEAMTHGE
jgi:alanine racemase